MSWNWNIRYGNNKEHSPSLTILARSLLPPNKVFEKQLEIRPPLLALSEKQTGVKKQESVSKKSDTNR
jgi:hypothetical protein